MNAIVARWETEQVRLWAGSALAALLLHLAIVALLFLRIQWQPRPSPLAGSPVALNVELASLPHSPSPAAASSRGLTASEQEQSPSKEPALAATRELQPLAEVQPFSPEVEPTPPDAAQSTGADATAPTPELSPLAAPELPAPSQPHGQPHAPPSPEQQWLAQVKDQLQRYKRYPRAAAKTQQQDTVTLKFSVNSAGQVTYVRIDSTHHYHALEREVGEMLYLAGRLPMPPAKLPVDKIVWNVPVDFYLTSAKPAPAHCSAPADPGPAPIGATATLQQMSAYRARLNQYLAATGKEFDCLARAPDSPAPPSRRTLTQQLHSMVDNFNTQARLFEARAQAEALQAQQAHQRQLQALATQVYAHCSPPVTPQVPTSLNGKTAQSYRRGLLGYQSAVSAYVGCLREARSAATAPERRLASDQRAQIDQTAMQLGGEAILPFNQLAAGFNGQVPRLRQQALAAQAQQNLAEALVRATAIFPDSTWDVPAPLPTGECFRITRSGQTYQARLCQSTFVTDDAITSVGTTKGPLPALFGEANMNAGAPAAIVANAFAGVMSTGVQSGTAPGDAVLAEATSQERIYAIHGYPGVPTGHPILGIEEAPQAALGQQSGPQVRGGQISGATTSIFTVSDLQISGRRVSMTISRGSNGASDIDGDWSPVHFDLVLSADRQTLHGYCWTGQQRSECTLSRQH